MRDIGNDGERLSAQATSYSVTHHIHRYAIAADLCCGKIVADIASGEGYGSNIIAARAKGVIGIDISEDAVNHASKKYQRSNLTFKLGSAARIPLEDSSVEIVTSFETIEHHDQHQEMLSEIKRILKPGGLLVISSPDKRFYSDQPNFENHFHVKELYESEFRELISSRFRNVFLYGQKIVGGSVVFPKDSTGTLSGFYAGDLESVRETDHLEGAQFFICLASDLELPSLRTTFFDGELIAEARRQEQAIARDLRNSISFKIGRAITAPLRWLRPAAK